MSVHWVGAPIVPLLEMSWWGGSEPEAPILTCFCVSIQHRLYSHIQLASKLAAGCDYSLFKVWYLRIPTAPSIFGAYRVLVGLSGCPGHKTEREVWLDVHSSPGRLWPGIWCP